jgi:hypothetical protein
MSHVPLHNAPFASVVAEPGKRPACGDHGVSRGMVRDIICPARNSNPIGLV